MLCCTGQSLCVTATLLYVCFTILPCILLINIIPPQRPQPEQRDAHDLGMVDLGEHVRAALVRNALDSFHQDTPTSGIHDQCIIPSHPHLGEAAELTTMGVGQITMGHV